MWLYTDLDSFDGIAKVYNSIEPLRGARKTWDIRPLGKRSKWWERILKIDENTYVLNDGWWSARYGNPGMNDKEKAENLHALMTRSPITWTRREDGDYVRIRSNLNNSSSYSRYKFLEQFLPRMLNHDYDTSGAHWIMHQGKKHLLPKGEYRSEWNPRTQTSSITKEVDKYLEFKYVDDKTFVLTHEPHKKTVPIVNREVSKQFMPAMRDLWEYAKLILPVYGTTLMAQCKEAEQAIGATWVHNIETHVIQKILVDPEKYAEPRLMLCIMVAVEAEAYEVVYKMEKRGSYTYRQPEGARFLEKEDSWPKFRKLLQKAGGMMTTKEVEFE